MVKINHSPNGKGKSATLFKGSKSIKKVKQKIKVKPSVIKSNAVENKKNETNIKTKEISKKVDKEEKLPENPELQQISDKYGVSTSTVASALDGFLQIINKKPKVQNKLFQDDHIPLFLQLCCIKIPKCPSKLTRILLKHSLLQPDDEVCLIVPDIKRINRKDHEKHVEIYEELLKKKGVDNINKIMTYNELKTEYDTFELKRGLVGLYESFLVDGKISGMVVQKLGKIFYDKRKVPVSVKLRSSNLKPHIDQALRKTSLQIHSKGDSFTVEVGHNRMDRQKLFENVFAAIEQLDKVFPGGFNNLRSIGLHTTRAPSIPIYLSLKNQNDVKVPKLKLKRPKAHKTVEGELTTIMNATVKVKPSGEVKVTKPRYDKKKLMLLKENTAGDQEGNNKLEADS